MINKYTLYTCNESETNLNETKNTPVEKHENVRYKKGQVITHNNMFVMFQWEFEDIE